MAATYSFIFIPLDARAPAAAATSFELKIVSQIQFPMGVAHTPAAIREALSQHPLLAPPTIAVKAFLWNYQAWEANNRTIDTAAAARVDVEYSGMLPRSALLATLVQYLAGSGQALPAETLDHDARFDHLEEEHFVDVAKAADDVKLLTRRLQFAALANLRSVTATAEGTPLRGLGSIESMSFGLARWVNAATQAALLDALSSSEDDDSRSRRLAVAAIAPALQAVRDSVRKINRRMTVDPDAPVTANKTRTLRGVRNDGSTREVNPQDLNVAVQSALKNSLLATRCGLVTSWIVRAPPGFTGPTDLIITLDTASLTHQPAIATVEPPVPTAFRRDTHTHPVAFADLSAATSRNGALACLSTQDGTARYRASCVNAEGAMAKQIVLQTSNSLAGPSSQRPDAFGRFNKRLDDRPPQTLAQQQFGIPEPETSGVMFSAPVEDLVTPAGLRFNTPEERRAALPCLFLEDLWIGYRLDVRRDARSAFASIHRQKQELQFSGGRPGVSGATEDYFDREQADDRARGHSSTDLFTFTGFSTAQAKDYLVFLGLAKTPTITGTPPFAVKVTVCPRAAERLVFGEVYEYRLRTVFLGALSCDLGDEPPGIDRFGEHYRQRFPFYRARALRPGEMLSRDSEDEGDEQGKTIYLTRRKPRVTVTFVPSPIDVDTSRFHGLLFRDRDESSRHGRRKHVADLGKFFSSLPPRDLDYFFDPDVHGLVVRAAMVNGDPAAVPEDFLYIDGTYCVVSRHVMLDPISEQYGRAGEWERFRPIAITFRTSNDVLPRVRRRGSWRGARRLEVTLPRAAELHLSVVPLIDPELIVKTAAHAASNVQFSMFGAVRGLDLLPVPALAEQTIKVIHAVEKPSRAPRLLCEAPRVAAGLNVTEAPSLAARELDSQSADVIGRVEVDAASTKEVRLEANWKDVVDDPRQPRYGLQSGFAVATVRSVLFQPFEPDRPSAAAFHALLAASPAAVPAGSGQQAARLSLADHFDLQCAEDKVFFGVTPTGAPAMAVDKSNRFDLKDQRRKLLSVEAVALSRFAGRFSGPGPASELRSSSAAVDVPSTVRMTAPIISHVVPLRRTQITGDGRAGSERTTFAMRIYLRRPWFESGPGERLAIGCAVGEEAMQADAQEVPKHITQWGEDPIERAGLLTTTRMPLASDFRVCDKPLAEADYSADLYPPTAVGGNAPVIYRDNVSLLGTSLGLERRRLSVASFAVRNDARQRLWYADIYVAGDFFGWCGLALYRHQPHALANRELSEAWDWLYTAVLHGEPVAWVERHGNLQFTIGPVYDANVSFEFDSLKYRGGVSDDAADRTQEPLRRYRVGRAWYFEGVVVKERFDWSLLKKRFAHPIASKRLRRI